MTRKELEQELIYLKTCLELCEPGDRWADELRTEIAKIEKLLKEDSPENSTGTTRKADPV